jgi:hypothetical protein
VDAAAKKRQAKTLKLKARTITKSEAFSVIPTSRSTKKGRGLPTGKPALEADFGREEEDR